MRLLANVHCMQNVSSWINCCDMIQIKSQMSLIAVVFISRQSSGLKLNMDVVLYLTCERDVLCWDSYNFNVLVQQTIWFNIQLSSVSCLMKPTSFVIKIAKVNYVAFESNIPTQIRRRRTFSKYFTSTGRNVGIINGSWFIAGGFKASSLLFLERLRIGILCA